MIFPFACTSEDPRALNAFCKASCPCAECHKTTQCGSIVEVEPQSKTEIDLDRHKRESNAHRHTPHHTSIHSPWLTRTCTRTYTQFAHQNISFDHPFSYPHPWLRRRQLKQFYASDKDSKHDARCLAGMACCHRLMMDPS